MLLWPFNKYPSTDYETCNWEWILEVVKKWNLYLSNMFEDPQAGFKEFWVNLVTEHPDWISTIPDHSITKDKMTVAYAQDIENYYVTPEMYGAVGDGVVDDTEAVQNALDDGRPILMARTYLISEPVHINRHNIELDATESLIRYNGDDVAVKLYHVNGGTVKFGVVESLYGDCIELKSISGSSDSIQYLNLEFNTLRANPLTGKCIRIIAANPGWINQVNVKYGQLNEGLYGVHFNCDIINMIEFDRIGIEGVTNGYMFDMPEGARIRRISWKNNRIEEYNRRMLIIVQGANVSMTQCEWESLYELRLDRINLGSTAMYNTKFIAPIIKNGEDAVTAEGVWFTSSGTTYFTYYPTNITSKVDTLWDSEGGTMNGNELVTAGTISYKRRGNVVTWTLFDISVSATGTILRDIPEALRPTIDTPFMAVTNDMTGLARGTVARNGTLYLAVEDTAKTYRGTITYVSV